MNVPIKRRLISFAVVFIALAVCCSGAHASYRSHVKKATKQGRLYDMTTGNARILMDATLFTDDFRRVFAEKDADIHYLNDSAAAELLADQMAIQQKGWEIFVGMFSPKDYTVFSTKSDSFWNAHLVTSLGEVVDPISIEEVKINPYWRVMFPYLTRWSRAYRVVFPKAALGDSAQMLMQSVVGETSVKWKIK